MNCKEEEKSHIFYLQIKIILLYMKIKYILGTSKLTRLKRFQTRIAFTYFWCIHSQGNKNVELSSRGKNSNSFVNFFGWLPKNTSSGTLNKQTWLWHAAHLSDNLGLFPLCVGLYFVKMPSLCISIFQTNWIYAIELIKYILRLNIFY